MHNHWFKFHTLYMSKNNNWTSPCLYLYMIKKFLNMHQNAKNNGGFCAISHKIYYYYYYDWFKMTLTENLWKHDFHELLKVCQTSNKMALHMSNLLLRTFIFLTFGIFRLILMSFWVLLRALATLLICPSSALDWALDTSCDGWSVGCSWSPARDQLNCAWWIVTAESLLASRNRDILQWMLWWVGEMSTPIMWCRM